MYSNAFSRLKFILLVLVSLGLLQGCSKNIQQPRNAFGGSAEWAPEKASQLWAGVLKRVVDSQGRIHFKKLAKDPRRLNAYVAWIGRVSPDNRPELFPNDNARLAYYLNSYNALAMYGVITNEVKKGFHNLAARARFFKFNKFLVGGERISLLDYENDVIRPLGDPRVHFALNCMVVGCPRLPQSPFKASRLDKQLEHVSREFLNESRNVRVLKDKREVELSEILDFYKEDFIRPGKTPTLIHYVNQYRKKPIPPNYDIDFIPYDWTLNSQ